MKIIISPAKKMNIDTETFHFQDEPQFLGKTEILMNWLKSLSFEEAKNIWKCNDKIAMQNIERLRTMHLHQQLTPALLSYEGIQYQYMAPRIFSDAQWNYVQEHLRILSGFYGILRPLDGVTPYRLEMQTKINLNGFRSLYAYWGKDLYQSLIKESNCILNLASKEYAKVIEKYATPDVRLITCIFGEWEKGKIVQKGTLAKMARGEMVRHLATCEATTLEQVKQFCSLDFSFSESHSTEHEFIFLRNGQIPEKENAY